MSGALCVFLGTIFVVLAIRTPEAFGFFLFVVLAGVLFGAAYELR